MTNSFAYSLVSVLVLTGLVHVEGPAQRSNRATTPAFEVASVRLNRSGDFSSSASRFPGGRITITNNTLKDLIRYAYDLKDYQVFGGPGWIHSERYDIAAKADGDPGADKLRSMLQTLLAERFGLKVHRETKAMPAYQLVVLKEGSRLRKSKEPASSLSIFRNRGQITARKTSMAQLANGLSGLLSRAVVDKTGISGSFDFTLEYAPLDIETPQDSLPSIFTALQEQLGLRLEARTLSIEVLVVDEAQQLVEN
jgi:uncharacterized protein (TIGR03435 family)